LHSGIEKISQVTALRENGQLFPGKCGVEPGQVQMRGMGGESSEANGGCEDGVVSSISRWGKTR